MQQLIKGTLVLLFILFNFSCSSQKRFDKEDYKIVNLFLENFNRKDADWVAANYDTIFLKENFVLEYDSTNVYKLKAKQKRHDYLKKKCIENDALYKDSLTKYRTCVTMKLYERFDGILTKEEAQYFMNTDNFKNEKVSVNKNKIANKQIRIVSNEKFYRKNYFPGKLIVNTYSNLKIEILELSYDKNKKIAFLRTLIKSISESDSVNQSVLQTNLYVKKNNVWVSKGILDY